MLSRMMVITLRVGQVQAVTPVLYELSGANSVLDVERLTIFPPNTPSHLLQSWGGLSVSVQGEGYLLGVSRDDAGNRSVARQVDREGGSGLLSWRVL